MAETVDSIPEYVHRGGHSLYPWDEWLDGRLWKLTRGEDFHNEPRNFAMQVRTVARRRGLKARVSMRDDLLFVQAVRDDG